jgi:hypothetical protein
MFDFPFLGFAVRIIPYTHTRINAQTGKFQAIKNTRFKHRDWLVFLGVTLMAPLPTTWQSLSRHELCRK